MLLFQGVTVRAENGGKLRRMALFDSLRCPGLHYEVEIDQATHLRLQAIMNAELETAAAFGVDSVGETDGPEENQHGHARRF